VQEGIQAEGDKDGAQQDADDDNHDFHECSVYYNCKISLEVYANRSLTSSFFGFAGECSLSQVHALVASPGHIVAPRSGRALVRVPGADRYAAPDPGRSPQSGPGPAVPVRRLSGVAGGCDIASTSFRLLSSISIPEAHD
jgi:hypothetical protein